MFDVLMGAGWLCVLLFLVSLFTRRTAFFFKEKTKKKALLTWGLLVFVFFGTVGVFYSDELNAVSEQRQARLAAEAEEKRAAEVEKARLEAHKQAEAEARKKAEAEAKAAQQAAEAQKKAAAEAARQAAEAKKLAEEKAAAQVQAEKVSAPVGHPLAVKILSIEKNEKVSGRNRLNVTMVPAEDQSTATQADLAATAVAVAMKAHHDIKFPIVTVTMKCQEAANAFGELQLAYVVYIPDGLGIDGKTPGKIWPFMDAAPRGFTKQELQYLKLWAELRGKYQTSTGTDEQGLKAAIAKKMGVKPDSLNPHFNLREPFKGKLDIEGELKIVQSE